MSFVIIQIAGNAVAAVIEGGQNHNILLHEDEIQRREYLDALLDFDEKRGPFWDGKAEAQLRPATAIEQTGIERCLKNRNPQTGGDFVVYFGSPTRVVSPVQDKKAATRPPL